MNMRLSHALAIAFVAIALLLVVAGLQPSQVWVRRVGPMGSSLPIALAVVGDLTRLPEWAPWMENAVGEVSGGKATRVGASYQWKHGKATLQDLTPANATLRLELSRPIADKLTLTVEFLDRSRVDVAINYRGEPRGLGGKIAGLFTNEEASIGPELEKALKRLKEAVDAETKRREAERLAAAKPTSGIAAPSPGAASFDASPFLSAPEAPLEVDSAAIEAERRRRQRRAETDKAHSTPD